MPAAAGNTLDPSRIEAHLPRTGGPGPADEAEAEAVAMIQDIVDGAVAAHKVGSLCAICAEWYRENIDVEGFKAGSELGPPAE
jgi:hypothetical protein